MSFSKKNKSSGNCRFLIGFSIGTTLGLIVGKFLFSPKEVYNSDNNSNFNETNQLVKKKTKNLEVTVKRITESINAGWNATVEAIEENKSEIELSENNLVEEKESNNKDSEKIDDNDSK